MTRIYFLNSHLPRFSMLYLERFVKIESRSTATHNMTHQMSRNSSPRPLTFDVRDADRKGRLLVVVDPFAFLEIDVRE